MLETKIKRFKWLFVLKGGGYTRTESKLDYGTGKWFSEPIIRGNQIVFIGTHDEISKYYQELIDNGCSVQDDYDLGEYEEENS